MTHPVWCPQTWSSHHWSCLAGCPVEVPWSWWIYLASELAAGFGCLKLTLMLNIKPVAHWATYPNLTVKLILSLSAMCMISYSPWFSWTFLALGSGGSGFPIRKLTCILLPPTSLTDPHVSLVILPSQPPTHSFRLWPSKNWTKWCSIMYFWCSIMYFWVKEKLSLVPFHVSWQIAHDSSPSMAQTKIELAHQKSKYSSSVECWFSPW